MTIDEFNKKWSDYLREDFYGMIIDTPEVVDYLDAEFEKEVKANPSFIYSQIKIKFGSCRIYANSKKTAEWEDEVNRLMGVP